MSNKIFTQNEINILTNNPYVKKVSSKAITYTDEFKRIFIAKHEEGNFPREIFQDHGFDIDIVGMQRVKCSAERWRLAYRKDSVYGLTDTRKGNSGRPNARELSTEEKNKRLKAQINLLKAENDSGAETP